MISNKLIGLASLVILCGSAGFTAVGCSSTTTVDDTETDSGATSSSGGGKDKDGGKTSSGGSSGSDTCEPATPADLNGGYPPAKEGTAGSCTQANIDAMLAASKADGGNITFDELFNAAGETCKSCFLSAEADESWGLFAKATDGYYTNPGWCYGNVLELPACGGTVSNLTQEVCEGVSCKDCGTRDSDTGEPDDTKATCEEEAVSGCKTLYATAVTADCGGDKAQDNLGKGDAACVPAGAKTNLDVWLHQIKVVCGSGASDAGTDGG